MGTISDKLMRIINTKEDIRQALISKGYDVPTSIPFKEYAKMILDLPCKADSFPDIEGIVARYSASGLTNEQMAANPVWVDKTGNGHDLQMKNFAWGGMSGVGGYVENYNGGRWVRATNRADMTWTSYSVNITSVKIASAQLYYQSYLEQPSFIVSSYTIRVQGLKDGQTLSYRHQVSGEQNIYRIIEDGIYTLPSFLFKANGDWYGFQFHKVQESCDITIEQLPLYPGALVFDGVDDYGVCENFPILTKEKGYTVVALRQYLADKSTAYLTANGDSISNTSFIFEGNNYKDTWNFGKATTIQASRILATQTSKQYDGVKLNIGTNTEGSNLLQVGKWSKSYSNVAIWELVFLDHDATEEELTKIKDYFVKTYPWLFPDQAWTVVGKTNEDEDRATITNITGNGNDLVLSNFGFAEGSGYNEEGEYAGYLVTDGVDDKVQSSSFTMNEDWTIVGDWELLSNVQINCGIVKAQNVYLYNIANGLLISINNPRSLQSFGTKSLHAICSDGRLYDRNWVEYEYTVDQNFAIVESSLNIGFNLNNYTQIAFKNLGIYNNQILSKENCIKAYNYLQTLKSK